MAHCDPCFVRGCERCAATHTSCSSGWDWPGVVAIPASGELMVLLRHLDGVRTSDEVVARCAGEAADPGVVQTLLEFLERTGLVVDQADAVRGGERATPASWASVWLSTPPGARAADIVARRDAVTYAVLGSGAVADTVRRALAEDRLSEHADRASFLIVAADREPDRGVVDAGLAPREASSGRTCPRHRRGPRSARRPRNGRVPALRGRRACRPRPGLADAGHGGRHRCSDVGM